MNNINNEKIAKSNERTEKLKSFRASYGLSQSEFAKKFHLNVATLQKWEQGVNPTPEYVIFMMEKIIDAEKAGYIV